MSERPWYHKGLRFECTECGDCCTGAPGYVWVNKAEIAAMAETLSLPVEEFERTFVRMVGIRKSLIEYDNGDCVFFDGRTRRCRVYNARPRQCGTWPFWATTLDSPQTWKGTARGCPGCNRGPLIPLQEIEARAAKIRI